MSVADTGDRLVADAYAQLKAKKKEPRKGELNVSTINFRMVEAKTEEWLENGRWPSAAPPEMWGDGRGLTPHRGCPEPVNRVCYWALIRGENRRFAYITSYSRVGLMWVHCFSTKEATVAAAALEAITDRVAAALAAKTLLPQSPSASLAVAGGAASAESTPPSVFHVTCVVSWVCGPVCLRAGPNAGDSLAGVFLGTWATPP